MLFQASELSSYGDVSGLAKAKISSVSSTQVKTGSDMDLFGFRIKEAIQTEAVPSSTKFDPVVRSIDATVKEAKYQPNTKLAGYFGTLKGLAQNMGATETAKAITTAAAWYYNNIEKPQRASFAPTAPKTSAPPEVPPEGPPKSGGPIQWVKDHPLATAGIGAGIVVLGVGALIYFNDTQAAAEARAAGRVRV